MNQKTDTAPDPQAVAEILWHRFELQDGKALALVLNQIEQQDNRQALVHWVRAQLAHYDARGSTNPFLQLESDLVSCLIESGLPGGELNVTVCCNPTGRVTAAARSTNDASQPAPRGNGSDTNIIPLGQTRS